jgi:hypothetical protein
LFRRGVPFGAHVVRSAVVILLTLAFNFVADTGAIRLTLAML